jgi:adenosylmethionine-8-amino-7-oxononanoate aminotransferase
LLHPFTRADDFAAGRVPGQRIVQSASGIRVTDAHGRSVIDGMSGMYCVNVGYGRKPIVDAIAEQASELPYYHIFAGASHPKAILLADKLLELDAINPQVAGRLARVMDRWAALAEPYRSAAREARKAPSRITPVICFHSA